MAHYASPTITLIRSLQKHAHVLSLYTKDMPYTLKADIIDLSFDTGRMIVEVEYTGTNIEHYLADGGLNFDIETLKDSPVTGRETCSFSNIPAKLYKTDSMMYQLEFQLPENIFSNVNNELARIPFVLGMQTRARIEVFQHELNVPGKLRELSVEGCTIEVDLVESVAFNAGQEIPGITLEFPNGDSFFTEGKVQHIRPFGNQGFAVVNLQFINLTSSKTHALFHYVNEAQREASYRLGIRNSMTHPSALFIPGLNEKRILQREAREKEKHARQIPMERDIMKVAHQLQIGLMYMKSRRQFPVDIFYDCVDTLLCLIEQDRKTFLYILSLLRDKPEWVRHAVQVAGKLADMLLLRHSPASEVREAVLGALLHTMGKPLLVSSSLPSLKINMSPAHKAILRGHVAELFKVLRESDWEPSPVCLDVIENANERLDGTGYPAGKQGKQLSGLVQLFSVIKAINKLQHTRNGMQARAPLDAYRQINDTGKAYNKAALIEYIQLYSSNPIGSLAKYTGGFLAWIMDIDDRGMPAKVQVVKDLRFPCSNISSIISHSDLMQIGKMEKIINPADYEFMSM
ncbi:metal-dependent phosphohydrolase (plasmid) [Pantoea alhagi]|uniref:Metal-dependent phosphohydrolase n=1 Tax=Pantoea alhagi TaxID=1891675 RepID=A0A1W6BBK2_9GAMM|nr:HD domain-containing phosphohydrolase [Pantoea alhagi]ARJ44413.1 metal-dependent phosphohydrolase [Pantoea alhagi]